VAVAAEFHVFVPFLPFPAVFVLHDRDSGQKQTERWKGRNGGLRRVAGCEWGAASDKRGVMFGAKPAQSEAPVRAAQRRTPGGVRSGRKTRHCDAEGRRIYSSDALERLRG
jgi:hypothetical protein